VVKPEMDITVILASYNRSVLLRQTLENFTRLNLEGLRIEFLVVDNNSSDDTHSVLSDYSDRLPLRSLFESSAGKNCALNQGLDEARSSEIVVFTDDDINPQTDWLRVIWESSQRWSEIDVFGGRIEPDWPMSLAKVPKWINTPLVKGLGFAWQDFGPDEVEYASDETPFGPNMWVRGRALANGRKFNEGIGPSPQGRTMGDETDFMNGLRGEGYKIFYIPGAMVHHHVEAKDMTIKNICRRSIFVGRGIARVDGICRKELLKKCPVWWYTIRLAGILILGFRAFLLNIFPLTRWRADKSIYAYTWFGYNIEIIMMAIDEF